MFFFTGLQRRIDAGVRQFSAGLNGGFSLDTAHRVEVQGRQVPTLRSGARVLNLDFDLADGFTRQTGMLVTLFARDGDDFIRITTSVRKLDGERAVGTPLDRSQPAYTDALQGRAHVGYAIVFGKLAAGSVLVDKTRQSMEQITSSIAEVVHYIDGIAHASQEQRAGIENVNRSVSEIDQMTQQNAALVEEAAAAAMRMRDQAHTLIEAVNTFKT